MQETVHTEPSPCSGTCGWTSPAACASCGLPLPPGAPSAVALSMSGPGWISCLQVLQGEWFWSAGGVLSCFRLELGEDAFFPRVESIALHVTAMPLAVVYLEVPFTPALHLVLLRSHALNFTSRHVLEVFSPLCRVFGLLRPVPGGTGWPQRLKGGSSHLICQRSLTSSC